MKKVLFPRDLETSYAYSFEIAILTLALIISDITYVTFCSLTLKSLLKRHNFNFNKCNKF